MKRWRKPKAKPGQLKACYGKIEYDGPDICYAWGDGVPRSDGHLLHNIFSQPRYRPGSFETDPSLYEELENRGYDITTIKFKIQKKTNMPTPTPVGQKGKKMKLSQIEKNTLYGFSRDIANILRLKLGDSIEADIHKYISDYFEKNITKSLDAILTKDISMDLLNAIFSSKMEQVDVLYVDITEEMFKIIYDAMNKKTIITSQEFIDKDGTDMFMHNTEKPYFKTEYSIKDSVFPFARKVNGEYGLAVKFTLNYLK